MDYATAWMYADDANNLTFTASSFPKLQQESGKQWKWKW